MFLFSLLIILLVIHFTRYKISTNLSARVGYFNPAWNDPNPTEKEEVDL
jgi:hypothetical protein